MLRHEESSEMSASNAIRSVGHGPAHFSTAFGYHPRMTKLVRGFVSDFHDVVVLGPWAAAGQSRSSPWASQLSMAAHELVENAMSHGPGDETMFSISIDPDPEDPTGLYLVCMTTRNRAEPHHQQMVRDLLHSLNEADDPLAFYVELMAASARRSEGSGLGLARVRVEADMDVTCVIDGDELEVTARARILRQPEAELHS